MPIPCFRDASHARTDAQLFQAITLSLSLLTSNTSWAAASESNSEGAGTPTNKLTDTSENTSGKTGNAPDPRAVTPTNAEMARIYESRGKRVLASGIVVMGLSAVVIGLSGALIGLGEKKSGSLFMVSGGLFLTSGILLTAIGGRMRKKGRELEQGLAWRWQPTLSVSRQGAHLGFTGRF